MFASSKSNVSLVPVRPFPWGRSNWRLGLSERQGRCLLPSPSPLLGGTGSQPVGRRRSWWDGFPTCVGGAAASCAPAFPGGTDARSVAWPFPFVGAHRCAPFGIHPSRPALSPHRAPPRPPPIPYEPNGRLGENRTGTLTSHAASCRARWSSPARRAVTSHGWKRRSMRPILRDPGPVVCRFP